MRKWNVKNKNNDYISEILDLHMDIHVSYHILICTVQSFLINHRHLSNENQRYDSGGPDDPANGVFVNKDKRRKKPMNLKTIRRVGKLNLN